MTRISISELRSNAGKYLTMAQSEDIFITKNGKVIARLTAVKPDKTGAAKSVFGLLPDSADINEAREERLK